MGPKTLGSSKNILAQFFCDIVGPCGPQYMCIKHFMHVTQFVRCWAFNIRANYLHSNVISSNAVKCGIFHSDHYMKWRSKPKNSRPNNQIYFDQKNEEETTNTHTKRAEYEISVYLNCANISFLIMIFCIFFFVAVYSFGSSTKCLMFRGWRWCGYSRSRISIFSSQFTQESGRFTIHLIQLYAVWHRTNIRSMKAAGIHY